MIFHKNKSNDRKICPLDDSIIIFEKKIIILIEKLEKYASGRVINQI